MTAITESHVEDSDLDWLKGIGWRVVHQQPD